MKIDKSKLCFFGHFTLINSQIFSFRSSTSSSGTEDLFTVLSYRNKQNDDGIVILCIQQILAKYRTKNFYSGSKQKRMRGLNQILTA